MNAQEKVRKTFPYFISINFDDFWNHFRIGYLAAQDQVNIYAKISGHWMFWYSMTFSDLKWLRKFILEPEVKAISMRKDQVAGSFLLILTLW